MRSVAALAALPLVLGLPAGQSQQGTLSAGKYIVVLKSNEMHVSAATTVNSLLSGLGSQITTTHTFDSGAFQGFAASLNANQANALKADPRVAYVEADGIMKISGDWQKVAKRSLVTQTGAPWGLGRISHKAKGSTDYVYDSTAGAGTCSYIVDTGINAEHVEFGGRATFVANMVTGGTATTDDNGHGTHCAGTIGSKAYGVAKATKLYGIKVLDAQGSGSYADVISGINLAVTDSKKRDCPNGVVVNMSLGGGKSQSVNDAVAAAVDAGLFFGVAAGNEAQDYHNTSPASEPKAFAVGASDKNDAMASFSNYGSGLGVIAPGVDILSTWIGSTTATNTISGTSMATPHTVGLAAYLLGLNGKLAVADLKAKIQSISGKGLVTGIKDKGTPNQLAFNGASDGSDPTPPPSQPPTQPPAQPTPEPQDPWWYWPWNVLPKVLPKLFPDWLIPGWMKQPKKGSY